MTTIGNKHFSSYIQCPYKAWLLLCTNETGEINDYENLILKYQQNSLAAFLENLSCEKYVANCLKKGHDYLQDVKINLDEFVLEASILIKREGKSSLGHFYYEPAIFAGVNQITKEHKLELAFLSLLLEKIQNKFSEKGTIISQSGREYRVELNRLKRPVKNIVSEIRTIEKSTPKLILNKHCAYCQFQSLCKLRAQQEDSLSLLDRISLKQINKYEKKGILTVKQLSFTYKPRRRNRHTRKPSITFKPEIQALAIRTGKVYIQQLPGLNRKEIEIFLDIEGVPDRNFFYLFGLLITQRGESFYEYYWIDNTQDEERVWKSLIDRLTAFTDSTIYHYGNFELSVFEKLSKRYQTDISLITTNFMNINSLIFGKVYFPAYSNGLKELGRVLGLKWTDAKASGLQSMVWRNDWEEGKAECKEQLLIYNREDCQALKVLTDELTKIDTSAAVSNDIDFAGKPKKIASDIGKKVHDHFKAFLQCSYSDYDKSKIKFNLDDNKDQAPKSPKQGAKKGYEGSRKKMPKANRVIKIQSDEFCYKHEMNRLRSTFLTSKRLIIDLVFTKNGVRKTITQYIGYQGYCTICNRYHAPKDIRQFAKHQLFGYNYKALIIFQRIVIQTPYEKIIESISEMFQDKMSWQYSNVFIKEFSELHIETEEKIKSKLLQSPFIHADETPVSIRGETQFVWVFTNGTHVVFKLSVSREAATAHEFLKNYQGVLISDFFAGYDNINCRQQKCWVHFIRDLNNALWEVPFDKEFETFVSEFRNLLLPIIQTTHKFGLKRRFLNKFKKQVDKFYQKHIDNKAYKSEYCLLYQKRFIRYRNSLFTFLEQDGINWHNNTAERGLRHVCKQKTISGSFHESLTPHYLRLVGIMQTCRFQGKSFFKFLLSKEKDVDAFKKRGKQSISVS